MASNYRSLFTLVTVLDVTQVNTSMTIIITGASITGTFVKRVLLLGSIDIDLVNILLGSHQTAYFFATASLSAAVRTAAKSSASKIT